MGKEGNSKKPDAAMIRLLALTFSEIQVIWQDSQFRIVVK